MKRKVSQIGPATLMVSLPSKWVKKYGLKKGIEVDVEEAGSSIIISTEASAPPFKTELNITNLDGVLLRRYLSTLYRMGADEINITFDNSNKVNFIQDVLQKNLIGFEIIKQGRNFCVIKSLSTETETEFDGLLRRIFLLLTYMSKEILDSIKHKDIDRMNSIVLLEQNNNRFTNFCRRVINKKGFRDYRKAYFVYVIIEQLEKIADEYKHLVDTIVRTNNIKTKLSDNTIVVFSRVNSLFEMFYELFYSFDNDKANRLIKERMSIKDECLQIMLNKSITDVIVAHHLMTITELTYNLLAPCIGFSVKLDEPGKLSA